MSDVPDGTTPGTVPGKPGILFVASTVLHPSALDPLDFTDWYENTHIQEVQSTGGISGTQRYESLDFHRRYRDSPSSSSLDNDVGTNRNFEYDFVTVYNMPDLAFRESEAFRGLDGQSRPNEQLLEKLFKQTAFITRFAEEVEGSRDASSSSGPALFLITVATHSTDDSAADLLSKLPTFSGYCGTRKLTVHEGSLLSEFQRSWLDEPKNLVFYEFDQFPKLGDLKKELESAKDVEVGFWRLRRDYQGSERTPAGWKPK